MQKEEKIDLLSACSDSVIRDIIIENPEILRA
jgi:hypothetical protein